MKGNSIAGFGIYASRNIKEGEIYLKERKSRSVLLPSDMLKRTGMKMKNCISADMLIPVSEELFILWDEDPSEWAPQNHSCDPNTAFDGLNVLCAKEYQKG